MNWHFDEVKPGMQEMEWLGGELALQRVRALMENLEPGLAPCPFCGARAVVRGIFRYASPGAMVECPRCHCGTPALIPGHDYLTGESETLEKCVKKAAARWNRRTEVKTA